MSFNRAILMGNVTRDPETRFTNSGMAIVSFGLAVNEKRKQPDGSYADEAHFFDVTLFGKSGEAFSRFHGKGSQAFIEGRLRQERWDDKKTGAKRSKVVVVGDKWEFCGGKKDESSGYAPAPDYATQGAGSSNPLDRTNYNGPVDDTPF